MRSSSSRFVRNSAERRHWACGDKIGTGADDIAAAAASPPVYDLSAP
jgi:hypothetical protein